MTLGYVTNVDGGRGERDRTKENAMQTFSLPLLCKSTFTCAEIA